MGKSGKTDRIEQFNTWFSQDIESYKEFAKNRVAAVRYSQEYLTELAWNIKDYLTEQEKNDTPFTVTGLYVSLGMQKKDYYRAKNGEFDWRLYQFTDFHGITLDEIVLQHAVGPNAELRTPLTLHTIADGDDDVEIIQRQYLGLFFPTNSSMLSGMCKICTHHFFVQFTLFKNIVYMPANHRSILLEQFRHLCL